MSELIKSGVDTLWDVAKRIIVLPRKYQDIIRNGYIHKSVGLGKYFFYDDRPGSLIDEKISEPYYAAKVPYGKIAFLVIDDLFNTMVYSNYTNFPVKHIPLMLVGKDFQGNLPIGAITESCDRIKEAASEYHIATIFEIINELQMKYDIPVDDALKKRFRQEIIISAKYEDYDEIQNLLNLGMEIGIFQSNHGGTPAT